MIMMAAGIIGIWNDSKAAVLKEKDSLKCLDNSTKLYNTRRDLDIFLAKEHVTSYELFFMVCFVRAIGIGLHYFNHYMHHIESKDLANMVMLKKVLLYVYAAGSLKYAIKQEKPACHDMTYYILDKQNLKYELIAFELNIVWEVIMFILAQCKSKKTTETKQYGHVALTSSSKYMNDGDPVHFAEPSVSWMSPITYLTIKCILFTWLTFHICCTWAYTGWWLHVWYFFSYWGVCSTALSTGVELLAAFYPNTYTPAAVLLTELSLGFNMFITASFWGLMNNIVFDLKYSGMDAYFRYHYTTTHSLPLITSIYCVYFTKNLKLFPCDWKIIFYVTLTYMLPNYIGGKVEGEAMYPSSWSDWSSPAKTIFSYTMMSLVTAGLYYIVAKMRE
jgi:hypothetical protein